MKKKLILYVLFILIFMVSCSKQEESKVIENSGELISQNGEIIISEISSETDLTDTNIEETPEIIENNIKSKQELSEEFKYLEGLSTEQVPWGPGKNFNADGKPTACVLLQDKYGSYDADFVKYGEESIGKVYLTFDEGYENGYTPEILDVLKEKGVKAVFFVTLPYVKSCPELVQRMIDEGHVVGNHTNKHPNMTTISAEEGYDNVADLHKYMEENFGYSMYLFRFPEGAFSEQNLGLLQSLGYRCVFWSFAYNDWDPENQMDPDKAFMKVTGSLHDGEIFLLHAVSKTDTEILGNVIDKVRDLGYTFELIER